ncbi:hypothetical protein CRUP_034089, partial [Coryphaenoides rupestris]
MSCSIREPYSRSRPDHTHRDFRDEKPYAKSDYMSHDFVEKPYDTPSTYRTMSYSNATPVKPSTPSPGSSRLIPLWVQLLVFWSSPCFSTLCFVTWSP